VREEREREREVVRERERRVREREREDGREQKNSKVVRGELCVSKRFA
jgi:hypothetical protein